MPSIYKLKYDHSRSLPRLDEKYRREMPLERIIEIKTVCVEIGVDIDKSLEFLSEVELSPILLLDYIWGAFNPTIRKEPAMRALEQLEKAIQKVENAHAVGFLVMPFSEKIPNLYSDEGQPLEIISSGVRKPWPKETSHRIVTVGDVLNSIKESAKVAREEIESPVDKPSFSFLEMSGSGKKKSLTDLVSYYMFLWEEITGTEVKSVQEKGFDKIMALIVHWLELLSGVEVSGQKTYRAHIDEIKSAPDYEPPRS